jgi:TRAP-type C4-dicarboxylate transport system substrate-binding protein
MRPLQSHRIKGRIGTQEITMKKTSPIIARRRFLGTSVAAAGVLSAPSLVRAQDVVTLQMSSWLGVDSLIGKNVFVTWAEEIPRITNGRVQIEILPKPLGPPPAHYELVTQNKVDLGFALHGYTQDIFPRAKVGQFSFLGDAYGASHAFSKVYGQLLEGEKEHEGMEVLGLFQHGPGVMMLKDDVVKTAADFQGLRVRTSGGYIAGLVERLGGVNKPMSPTVVRQAFLDDEIDAVMFPYEGAQNFNLMDLVASVSELPGGYYNATWFLGLSPDGRNKLSAEDFAAIKEYSANIVHVLAAKAFDYADYIAKQNLIELGVDVAETSPELTEHIRGLAKNYEDNWSAEMASAGYDGARALAFTRRITGGG